MRWHQCGVRLRKSTEQVFALRFRERGRRAERVVEGSSADAKGPRESLKRRAPGALRHLTAKSGDCITGLPKAANGFDVPSALHAYYLFPDTGEFIGSGARATAGRDLARRRFLYSIHSVPPG
jgi:hypothetical protein